MFSADQYVKAFVDGNWLTIGIVLIFLRSLSNQFKFSILHKLTMVFNNTMEFIRPSSKDTKDLLKNGENK